jgi:hypothetical protein
MVGASAVPVVESANKILNLEGKMKRLKKKKY